MEGRPTSWCIYRVGSDRCHSSSRKRDPQGVITDVTNMGRWICLVMEVNQCRTSPRIEYLNTFIYYIPLSDLDVTPYLDMCQRREIYTLSITQDERRKELFIDYY